MSKDPGATSHIPDPQELSQSISDIAARSQRLIQKFLENNAGDIDAKNIDPLNIAGAFLELTTKMMENPTKLVQAQMALWNDYIELWQHSTRRWFGDSSAGPVIKPGQGDRRFKDPAWQDAHVFDFIKQSYLLTARWMQGVVHDVDGMDEHTAHKVEFYTKQVVDAMSPSNFVATNPEVIRTTLESGGENLVHGLQNLLEDLERGKGISMTDRAAFEVGRNVAASPGKVVFRNELVEILQFDPTTTKVRKVPLLITPPWINKYYILDLRPENSFIKWASDQGHSVFVVSWVNPDESLHEKSFDDYMTDGLLAAIGAVCKTTAEKKVNLIGYCIGGTLTAATLAYMKAKGDDRVASVTFFTTLTDFAEAGDLRVFIDDPQLDNVDEMMGDHGYLDGGEMSTAFNMLRANDLIWSFVVSNYLLGKDPFPFDLLYWNSDTTRMPKKLHSFYLRNMYLKNKLVEPGGIELDGVPIDLRAIDVPVYMVSPRDDHIAPWKATYRATQLYQGPVRFVVSGSGHIAGIVNPPSAKKYGHWTNEDLPASADDWFAGAKQHDGSWWPDWQSWIKPHAGSKNTPARDPAKGKLKPLGDAPGTFVKG